MILIFGVFTLISWPILLPINSINMPGGGKDGLVRLSWSKWVSPSVILWLDLNVVSSITEGEHKRYVAHVILVYIMTCKLHMRGSALSDCYLSFRILPHPEGVAYICARTASIFDFQITLSSRASKDCAHHIHG